MITIDQHEQQLTITRDGQTLTIAATDAPQLLGAILRTFGVHGSTWQRGYQVGYSDGTIEGYRRRDGEYITQQEQEQREQMRAIRRQLLATLDGDTPTA